jgi:hypothetical protein
MRPATIEELEAAKAALDRMAKRKPETAEEWARRLAPQFVAAGIEYDRQFSALAPPSTVVPGAGK